jgi:hypothetical protein
MINRAIFLDCSEFTIHLDSLFRSRFVEYNFVFDIYLVGDFLHDYLFGKVRASDILSYFDWDTQIDNSDVKDELRQIAISSLPILKRRFFELETELTDSSPYEIVLSKASIMFYFELKED